VSNYLVTGAAGFIAAHIARRLIEQGHSVSTIDNLHTGRRSNVPDGVHFVHGGCENESSYLELPGAPWDGIVHFAGQSSGEISFDDPSFDLDCNVRSTLRILDFARKHGCRRIIYASSMSVYGQGADVATAETATPKPESFYGVGKYASEHYLRIYRRFGIESVCLRLFTIYGPGQNLDNFRQGMVSIFMEQMFRNNRIQVKGAGDRFRDLVHVDDVVEVVTTILRDDRFDQPILNIGTGVKTTVDQLLQCLIRHYGRPVDVCHEGSTAGDIHGICADTTLLKRTLGLSPRVDLETGVGRFVEWRKGLVT
jgi:UDP-glucose 4-epimerase